MPRVPTLQQLESVLVKQHNRVCLSYKIQSHKLHRHKALLHKLVRDYHISWNAASYLLHKSESSRSLAPTLPTVHAQGRGIPCYNLWFQQARRRIGLRHNQGRDYRTTSVAALYHFHMNESTLYKGPMLPTVHVLLKRKEDILLHNYHTKPAVNFIVRVKLMFVGYFCFACLDVRKIVLFIWLTW